MKKMFFVFLLIFFNSCFNTEHWVIKEIKFSNGEKIYFKSHSWGVPERNSIILSNHKEKRFDNDYDVDFGSFVDVIYELKNDSLFIYESQNQEKYINIDTKFYNTKMIFVDSSLYIELMDSLKKFPTAALSPPLRKVPAAQRLRCAVSVFTEIISLKVNTL